MARRALLAEPGIAVPLPDAVILPDELLCSSLVCWRQQRRLYAGLEALKSGYGGDTRIAELLVSTSAPSHEAGVSCLSKTLRSAGTGCRWRAQGGGKKTPAVITRIQELMAHDSRRPDDRVKVDPQDNGQGRRRVAGAWHQGLRQNGGQAAQEMNYSLRVNHKKLSRVSPEDRDVQFACIAQLRECCAAEGLPLSAWTPRRENSWVSSRTPVQAGSTAPYWSTTTTFAPRPRASLSPTASMTCRPIRARCLSVPHTTRLSSL